MTESDLRAAQRRHVFYNQAVNVTWALLGFAPLCGFWLQAWHPGWFTLLAIVSALGWWLPASVWQWGQTPEAYHRLGLRTVKRFTQDGDLIHRALRRKFPQYRPADPARLIRRTLTTGRVNETFHQLCFLFFLLSSGYALGRGSVGWAAWITVANVVFNLYPIFLQQYNRLRLHRLRARYPAAF
ncbi:hypothetical protein SAMN05421823_104373 [Catalinimonas alkaloidigena]|uniref:Glycosyl-4,4'-diaponeurosporenoate acyltransferase n=1 Tax=Catalinimonas alkaloidigena TaxID=1075417 RepID=A0A1G9HAU8_9BACT|nr:hypothetical protein [Catalinimonas alkaloidigena]SDL09962.1 hypothetical protein SAMN05421823_104373 [Catalinimonas alkaloidigena]